MAAAHDVARAQMMAGRENAPAGAQNAAPAYLEPGPMNRLYLSLRSGIASQVDWALNRWAAYTSQVPEKISLSNYPGLADALADLLRYLFMAKRGEPRPTWDVIQRAYNLNGTIVDQGIGGEREVGYAGLAMASVQLSQGKRTSPIAPSEPFQPARFVRDAAIVRRAMEAALILRNLAFTPSNLPSIAQVPHFLHLVYDGLLMDESIDGTNACADIRPNMLDILECLASHLVLSDWVRRRYVLGIDLDAPAQYVEDQLFAVLYHWIHTSNDRALLLGSCRCCRAFASNPNNASVLAEVDAVLRPTSLRLVQRCLTLLPLTQDPELLEAVLDLLYQLLAADENALVLGLPALPAQMTPHSIVHFLARNLAYGKSVWERDTPMTPNQHAWWASIVPNTQLIRQQRELERREKMSPMERQRWKVLSPEARARIGHLPEPERGTQWMKELFEYDARGEVTQMEFWIAYRDQFTPLVNAGGAPLQPAANLIRNVSQTFPGAAAMVISTGVGTQPRFVIRGIAPRVRENLSGPMCPWIGCPTPQTPTWDGVREHLTSHAAGTRDGLCRSGSCTYAAPSSEGGELRQHVRTHLPPGREEGVEYARSAPPATGTHERPGVITFDVERTPSIPTSVPGQPPTPCGIAFLSLLILRYMARFASLILRRHGFGCPNYTYGGAVASSRQPSERDAYFGFPLAQLTEDVQSQKDTSHIDDRYTDAAVRIMQALASAESVLVETSLRNDILCRLANETLAAIRPVQDEHDDTR